MIQSMYSGVSGLQAHQSEMDVIGNNIANINTTGFKSSRVEFKQVLSQTVRDGVPGKAGVGTPIPSRRAWV